MKQRLVGINEPPQIDTGLKDVLRPNQDVVKSPEPICLVDPQENNSLYLAEKGPSLNAITLGVNAQRTAPIVGTRDGWQKTF